MDINTDRNCNTYFDSVISHGFFPRITLPTRISDESTTLIDNIFCNNIDIEHISGILVNKISDHQMIYTYHPHNTYTDNSNKCINVEINDPRSMNLFVQELNDLNIYGKLNQSICDDPQTNYEVFSKLVNYAKEKHLPRRTVKYNKRKHKKCKWITMAIIKSIKTKDKLYKNLLLTETNTPLHNRLKHNFKLYQKILKSTIKEAKHIYYHRLFNIHRNNIKKTWSIITDTLNHKQKSDISKEFIINNRVTTDSYEIANQFNNYFINIGKSLSDEILTRKSFNSYLNTPCDKLFKFSPVDENTIISIINELKNNASTGHDNISNKLLKFSKNMIVKPLTLIVNQTLMSGKFPSQLKLSKVKPLFKKNDCKQLSNYRPISLLPSISKIFERVIFNQINEYLTQNNLLSSQQFGFRRGHSTELAALKLVNHAITEMNDHNSPITIFIDLSKAFDTLNHDILLKKLKYYGICGLENDLFCSYLFDRQQYVEYNGIRSPISNISTGVPQGSILGPLLFLIYINDLPCASTLFDMLMYADDTTLYCNIDQTTNSQILNHELGNIYDWLSANKLSLNTAKTKFMIFHTKNKRIPSPSLKINNIAIERVTHFNFLGLIIDCNLNWKKHLDHISLKISKAIGIMHRLKSIYPEHILLNIYNALILPHFNYCLLSWGTGIGDNHHLHILQKKAIRLISNSNFISHTEPIFKRLKLLKITDIFTLAVWKFYYKLMNDLLPHYFNNIKPRLPDICNYYSIRAPLFTLPKVNIELIRTSIKYILTNLLNTSDEATHIAGKVHTHSLYGYKLYLKNSMIQKYNDACTTRNCYVCNRLGTL